MQTLKQFDKETEGTQEHKASLIKNIKSRGHYIKLLAKGDDVLVLDFEVYPKLMQRNINSQK